MKFKSSLIILLGLYSFGFSQNTKIPNRNFERALIELGIDFINSEPDGFIPTSRIAGVESLNVAKKLISDLTGIEDFLALKSLNCAYNPISELNVSSNSALEYLNCSLNLLTSLDVSSNKALTSLNCSSNLIKNLDLSSNTALIRLYCGSNELTNLDLSFNSQLESLSCTYNNLSTLDLSSNTALIRLYCGSNELTNLDLSFNSQLESLSCAYNNLSTLDVSFNPVLSTLYCVVNNLDNLNLRSNVALTYLNCGYNKIASLDVSSNKALIDLNCHSNLIKNLDLSNNKSLELLNCGVNQLNFLDIRNGNNSIIHEFRAESNPDLKCIFVDDLVYSYNNWADVVDDNSVFVNNETECNALIIANNSFNLKLSVVPNPSTNFSKIDLGSKYANVKVVVFDSLGRSINEFSFPEIQIINLNLENFNVGVYFIKIHALNNDKSEILKFIVK
ncbi:T9SS type A sorting domain-containing protein [Algibacter amylolyticus]|uniref:T9SS type A sorting domain-containing protein n=2 Tax=Algibacter amylolyticus TaxID=1608400 RepID=A0A5M7BFE7_9FLAO|nr:T9SS type A sorting domain-containing protein [Algibacter amylolyticus]KAA5827298.1 T9SS type A sorting domain-containing protein [Algibacter amylolyticus]TSJ81543.1 T9SS type A sorting domain-containing protein [Algibacter amylolyticus]